MDRAEQYLNKQIIQNKINFKWKGFFFFLELTRLSSFSEIKMLAYNFLNLRIMYIN